MGIYKEYGWKGQEYPKLILEEKKGGWYVDVYDERGKWIQGSCYSTPKKANQYIKIWNKSLKSYGHKQFTLKRAYK